MPADRRIYLCGGFNTPTLCVVTKGIKAECNHLMRTTYPDACVGVVDFVKFRICMNIVMIFTSNCFFFETILKYAIFLILEQGFCMEDLQQLKKEIKETIIKTLQLEDITPESIIDSEPLFGKGLGLDSIDALELGVGLKKKFGVKFSSESEDNKKHFASVNALAEYIVQTRG